jgi:3-methyladenine DNA glycosylase AlkD
MTKTPVATSFVRRLDALKSADKVDYVARFFTGGEPGRARDTRMLGVPFGQVFAAAKQFTHASLDDIEALLESPFYEVRMGAVSIMDFQARAKTTTPSDRKALFDLYIRRHDRINNWDLVDRAAPHVVGRYLIDRPRDVLYKLARSKNPWERRTAIVSTYYFIRAGDVGDTFRVAELLVDDPHELVQKATGSWLREAGKKDPTRLVAFLERHAATMPRTTLRYAVEKLNKTLRTAFMNRGTGQKR